VGWLASILKRNLGTGVFVVCGQNSRRGGIFDYWGVPLAMRNEAMSLLNELRHDLIDDSGNTQVNTRSMNLNYAPKPVSHLVGQRLLATP
jgi:hypothetical protein